MNTVCEFGKNTNPFASALVIEKINGHSLITKLQTAICSMLAGIILVRVRLPLKAYVFSKITH